MAQESNTLETRNTGGLLGGVAGLINSIGKVVTTAAPLAADVYSLQLQRDMLKNQSAADLQKLKEEQEKLARAASTPGPAGMAMPAGLQSWHVGAGIVALLLVVLVFLRRRR